jgi:hypothetical protein
MKPFADVTDEDQEAMTPDEYTVSTLACISLWLR